MTSTDLKLVFGGGVVDSRYGFSDPDELRELLDTLPSLGINSIDTAFIYNDSEELFGNVNTASRFSIDTKYPGGFVANTCTKDGVIQYAKQSLERLRTDSVDIYYQHAPDPQIPLEDTLEGVNEVYKAGKFKRFGISNFSPSDIENAIRICEEKNYVLPTVYQGNYNAFARHTEADVIPVLRKYGIAFYAYSTSAGGFLAKTSDQLRNNGGTGRWSMETQLGQLYNGLYSKEALFDGLDAWNAVAKEEGISGIEMAYRWIAQHSKLDATKGDAVIVGARSVDQTKTNVAWMKKGPLSPETVKKIDAIWDKIAGDAPSDNFHSLQG